MHVQDSSDVHVCEVRQSWLSGFRWLVGSGPARGVCEPLSVRGDSTQASIICTLTITTSNTTHLESFRPQTTLATPTYHFVPPTHPHTPHLSCLGKVYPSTYLSPTHTPTQSSPSQAKGNNPANHRRAQHTLTPGTHPLPPTEAIPTAIFN